MMDQLRHCCACAATDVVAVGARVCTHPSALGPPGYHPDLPYAEWKTISACVEYEQRLQAEGDRINAAVKQALASVPPPPQPALLPLAALGVLAVLLMLGIALATR